MANEIKSKFGTLAAITLDFTPGGAGLASATGRQTAVIDNTTFRYSRILLFASVQVGTSPNANSTIEFYLFRTDNDGTEHRDDEAAATEGALTPLNSQLIGTLRVDAAGTTDKILKGSFIIDEPGPEWGIIVYNRTGVALKNLDTNNWLRYVGINPEVQ
jgi:hypothetical protein